MFRTGMLVATILIAFLLLDSFAVLLRSSCSEDGKMISWARNFQYD